MNSGAFRVRDSLAKKRGGSMDKILETETPVEEESKRGDENEWTMEDEQEWLEQQDAVNEGEEK